MVGGVILLQEHQQFARRISLIGITNLLIGFSGLILLPILTKTLPIEEYGTYVQITVTISLVPGLVMLGLPYTMVRFLAATESKETIKEEFYSIAGIIVISSGITSIALFIFAAPIAGLLFDSQIIIIQILAITIFFECMNNLQYNYFRTFQEIKRYSSLLFSKTCLQLILVGGLVLSGHGVFGAAIGILITDLILFLIMDVYIFSEIGIAIPKFLHIREYLSFGIPTVPGNFSNWIVSSSDRYVIAFFLGTAYVGYYSPGYTLGNIISLFIAPISFMLPAVLSKYYDDENLINVKMILSYSLKYFLILAIPSVVGLSLLSKSLLILLSTSDIAAEGNLITPLIAICALLYGIYTIAVQKIILHKKTGYIGFIWLVAAGINISLNILLIPIFGIIGAATTTLISFCIATIFILFKSQLISIVTFDKRYLLKCVVSSFFLSIFILFLDPCNFIEIVFTIVCGVLLYFGLMLVFNSFSREEINFFKNLIFKI